MQMQESQECSINSCFTATENIEMVGTRGLVERSSSQKKNCYYNNHQLSHNESPHRPQVVRDQDRKEEEEEEEEFSFVCTNPVGPLISAEDIFHNGQIRSIIPLSNRDARMFAVADTIKAKEVVVETPLMFVEERSETDGPCCVWTGGRKASSRDGQICKRSNCTGFSKLRRFKEIVLRSNSDGKDAFIFLNNKYLSSPFLSSNLKRTTAAASICKRYVNEERKKDVAVVKRKEPTSEQVPLSPHEMHYLRNRAIKVGDRRKSYLPYRQDILGFFTAVNNLSRNVHPF